MKFIFPSTIIISNNTSQVTNYINEVLISLDHSIENNPDIYNINEYTIEKIRDIKNFLSKKPFSHNSKIVTIIDAHKLNKESQNALLKTLEEPGKDNYIILTTDNTSSLLPTILSRCQLIKINNKEIDKQASLLTISTDISKNFLISEDLAKDKDSIIPYIQNQIELYHQELIKNPNKENSQMILKLQKAIDMIKSNVDAKSALDYIFLT